MRLFLCLLFFVPAGNRLVEARCQQCARPLQTGITMPITKTEQAANLFVTIAQITRLLYMAYAKDRVWSYEIGLLKGPEGESVGKCFEDGCTITIKIAPPSTIEPDVSPATH